MSLTEQEKIVLATTASLWNQLNALPPPHRHDREEHMRDIHNIQNRIMARLAVRSHPEIFN